MSPETLKRIREMRAELEKKVSHETIVTAFKIQMVGIDAK